MLEVLSVVEFVSPRQGKDFNAAFGSWRFLDEVVTTTALQALLRGATAACRGMEASDPDRLAKAIVLGFLIDEIEGRIHYPN
jgi:hypothetical protein